MTPPCRAEQPGFQPFPPSLPFQSGWFFPAIALLFALASTGCPLAKPGPPALHVAAAVSLRPLLSEMETGWEAAHPRSDLVFHFASSGALSAQIAQGAPLHLFLSAHPEEVRRLQEEGFLLPAPPVSFARNGLALVWRPEIFAALFTVPHDAPLSPSAQVAALADPRVRRISLADPASVPLGRYAAETLRHFEVWPRLAGRLVFALNAQQVLAQLDSGSIDAALIYQSDLPRRPDSWPYLLLPASSHAPMEYLAALTLPGSTHPHAPDFLRFLSSPDFAARLQHHGFTPLPQP